MDSTGGTTESNRIAVLYVDDDAADFVTTALERTCDEITVTAVEGAETALDRIEDGGIDCVVSEYALPDTTGIDLLERVRERDVDLPFVLFAASVDDEVTIEALTKGVTDLRERGGDPEWPLLAARIVGAARVYRRRSRERATREAEPERRELERRNERLDEFTSIVSHDLQSPLNVARGSLHLARETDDHDHLDRAERALDRMEALIENFLALAREGKQVQSTESVDLADVARSAWSTVETRDAELDADAAHLQADPSRLRQLLENLFRNAIEHGGRDVTVRVGPLPGGFYVEDTGSGVPAVDRERVFEPGFTTTTDGTGIGLVIVREMAAAHGWDVRLVEGAADGARFEFTRG